MTGDQGRGLSGLQQAFDEVRFGAARTLNLRISQSSASAATRLEQWLRLHQAQRSASLLVITGRGKGSLDGVPVVKEASIRIFHELRRKGVISGYSEHTAGSFVVVLAPMSEMVQARQPRHAQAPWPEPVSPPTLQALPPATRDDLRTLAERSLDALGVHERERFLEDEMLRLFGEIAATVPAGLDREGRLRDAIVAAMSDYD